MQFVLDEAAIKRAKVPHELFLTNLIGNHILWFVAALGMAGTFWQPLLVVPVVSFGIMLYTLWRAAKARRAMDVDWFASCHWQLAARRSKLFLTVMAFCTLIALGGWIGYTLLGLPKVVVLAFSGGVGLLPTMVTVLVLIVLGSDGLHQASHARMPDSLYARFPNPAVPQVESEQTPESVHAEAHHQ